MESVVATRDPAADEAVTVPVVSVAGAGPGGRQGTVGTALYNF